MSKLKLGDFNQRREDSAKAKAALLESFKAKPAEDDPEVAARRAERIAVAQAREAREAAKREAREAGKP